MRKLKTFMALSVLIALSACTGSKPETVAEKFTKAFYTADFEVAKTFCTEDSKQAVDFVSAFATQREKEIKKADIQFIIKEMKMSEDGNSADINGVVTGSIDLKDGSVKDSSVTKLHLVKQEGNWLVDFKLK